MGAAGVILVATFSLVAIIPLFRQIPLTMATGLLIHTSLIRPILTLAMLILAGPVCGWPSRRLRI